MGFITPPPPPRILPLRVYGLGFRVYLQTVEGLGFGVYGFRDLVFRDLRFRDSGMSGFRVSG